MDTRRMAPYHRLLQAGVVSGYFILLSRCINTF